MADKNVNIKITAESKEAEKSLNTLTSKINQLGKSSTVKSISRLATAVTQSLEAFGSLKSAVADVVSTLNECMDAYGEQRVAELALQQAAANNPYLDRTAVSNLKEYATQMSRLSGIADEELLPAMTQLASAGRTESEIMQVVSAACDIAASGTMSFESAASELGKTYTGTVGALADMVPAVQSLTKEQLAEGKAVELIAASYAGMAERIQEVNGGAQRLSTAMTTLKEEIGAAISGPVNSLQSFFASALEGFTDMLTAMRRLGEERDRIMELEEKGEGGRTLEEEVEYWEGMIADLERRKANGEDGAQEMFGSRAQKWLNECKEYQNVLTELANAQVKLAEAQEELNKANAEAAAQAEEDARNAKAAEEEDDRNARAQAMIDAYKARIEAVKKTIEVSRELGEEISELEAAERVAEAQFSGLVELVANSDGLITTENSFFKAEQERYAELAAWIKENSPTEDGVDELEELKDAIEAATPSPAEWRELSDTILNLTTRFAKLKDTLPEEEAAALEEQIESLKAALTAPELKEWESLEKEAESIYERIAELEVLAKEAAAEGKVDLEKAYLEEIERLNEEAAKKSAEAWDSYVAAMKEKLTSLVSQITSNLSQVASTISSACDLLLETAEASLEATLSKLEIAYLSGEMDEESYNEAVVKAKKEAAKEEYKIEMWEWAASLLTATANIAQGVTQAIAQGGVAGIITGALVSAAGAVQIASIVASKPTPPTFSTGGIVGGSSYTGDRVQALLNSGEMVLNAGQQKNLFDSINSGNIGKGAASGQSNVTQVQVNNSASNIVSAQPEISENQVKVMIDMRVNESMKKGRYSKALTQAEQGKTGKWYGS